MPTARELITTNVAEGTEADRLADVALNIQAQDVHYCVVLDEAKRRFLGLIRLAEVAVRAQPSNRILADLISPVKPLIIRAAEPADHVARLFTEYRISEGVVLDPQGSYLGLITARSLLAWSEQERQRAAAALQEARLQLEAASRAQKNLIESLSHELRTPLVPALLLASNGASDPSVPQAQRRHFEEIAEFVAHEAKLVDDLLDQKTIQRGDLAITRVPILLDTVLRRAIASVQAKLTAKTIVFDYTPAGVEPGIAGDPERLDQAFSNLLDNAVKFTPSGGRIRLSAVVAPDSSAVAITLADTGMGFAPDERARAFFPFSRRAPVNPHQAQLHPGLGLGLSITRAIIELHGGSIEISSGGRNLGSTIVVTLPV